MTHAEAFFSSFDFDVNVATEKRRSVAAPDARTALLKLFYNCGVKAAIGIVVAATTAGAFRSSFRRSQPLRHLASVISRHSAAFRKNVEADAFPRTSIHAQEPEEAGCRSLRAGASA